MERGVPNFNFMDIKQHFVFLKINEDINIYNKTYIYFPMTILSSNLVEMQDTGWRLIWLKGIVS
jgi:hypothetical protein